MWISYVRLSYIDYISIKRPPAGLVRAILIPLKSMQVHQL